MTKDKQEREPVEPAMSTYGTIDLTASRAIAGAGAVCGSCEAAVARRIRFIAHPGLCNCRRMWSCWAGRRRDS